MRGFIVDMQVSKKTNSIYLKIDNGACDGIRIRDHVNSQTKYKFNMIRNYCVCILANLLTRTLLLLVPS